MFEITAVVIRKGSNYHKRFVLPFTDFTARIDNLKYTINQSGMFEIKNSSFNFVRKLKNRKNHIKKRFMIFFYEGKQDALALKEQSGLVTSEMLHIVERSSAMSTALRSLFQTHIGGKKIIFIGIVIAIGVVIYLVMTGQLNLNTIMGGKR